MSLLFPSSSVCYIRGRRCLVFLESAVQWNRWSTACLKSGITRLEDCSTGQSLGTLPQVDESDDEGSDDYDDNDSREMGI